jgi:hypothetical protein
MTWSILDLSSITDDLIDMLTSSMNSSPLWVDNGGTIPRFNISPSGAMPESVRNASDGNCQLSLYLLHVSPDKFQRNGQSGQTNRQLPLALDLYYLLTAFAGSDYHHEQQAMSIALRCLHERPIVKHPNKEYTLTLEVQSADDMARLWQALSTPLRLSTVYKASVIFMTPSETIPPAGPPPRKIGLSVDPTQLPVTGGARVFGVSSTVAADVPPGATPSDVGLVAWGASASVARAGDNMVLTGAGLDLPEFSHVYLVNPDATELEVSAWRTPPTAEPQVRLRLPAAVGAAPGATPTPGIYSLRVGSDAPATVRSNAVPLSIAARIDGVLNPPRLVPDGLGFYNVAGAGFTAAEIQVFLGAQALHRVAATPGPGEFQVGAGDTSFRFKPPASLAPGRHALGVRVNSVDSPPSWYVEP